MPQYVSLAQQGFFQPYELLGDSLRAYQQRKQQQGQFNRTMSLQEAQREDLNRQRAVENALAQNTFNITAPLKRTEGEQAAFNLGAAKLAQQQALGLTNFNIHNMGTNPAAASVPETIRRPGAVVDTNTPFERQPPEVQQNVLNYAAQNKISPSAAVHAFRQQQIAETNRPFLPPLPGQPTTFEFSPEKGLTIKGYYDGGSPTPGNPDGTPSAPTKQAPPGYEQYRNPQTGEVSLVKKVEMDGGEAQRMQSLDTLAMQLKMLKDNMAKLPLGTGVIPGVSFLSRHWPNILGGPNKYAAGFEANRAAIGPDIYRGLMNQQGIMRDEARKEVNEMIPQATDSPEVKAYKVQMLEKQLAESRKATLGTLQMAGRDTRGFNLAPLAGAEAQTPSQKFSSIAAAQSARLPKGTVVEVYDPATQRYRPWTP